MDYRYALTFDGFVPNFVPSNTQLPEPGGLQFSILLRNYSPGPIQYRLEAVDIRIGTRALPKYKTNTVTGYLARGAARIARPEGFKGGTLGEFFGKGLTNGSADFSICYGPPDGAPVRRLRVSLDLYISFPKDGIINVLAGEGFAYSDGIISEEDEAIGDI
jgi:hypothetical protein